MASLSSSCTWRWAARAVTLDHRTTIILGGFAGGGNFVVPQYLQDGSLPVESARTRFSLVVGRARCHHPKLVPRVWFQTRYFAAYPPVVLPMIYRCWRCLMVSSAWRRTSVTPPDPALRLLRLASVTFQMPNSDVGSDGALEWFARGRIAGYRCPGSI